MPRLLVAALVLLVARVAAAAPSTCLVAPFTLADQRGFATLQATTDATCPCDGFATPGAYRRCARGVLDAAVADGTLRADCAKPARKRLKGVACGGRKVPCGQVKNRDGTAACKLAGASACRSTRAVTKTACDATAWCSDVVDWTAGTCLDPRAFGPYAPGHRLVTWTKDSVASPGTPRPLATSIWYPAAAGSGPIDPATGGVADAPLDASGGPYPVVLFSHGLCGIPTQSRFLTPLLASWGFVVVAPPHPGNTLLDFPTCATPAAIATSLQERPQDVVFVLDRILEADQNPASPFFGAIDETRVGMTGHSFGGLTTYFVAAIDPRIDVAVPMAPASLAGSVLHIPSLTLIATKDGVVDNGPTRTAYERSDAPKMLVEILDAGHYAFSDFCRAGSDCQPPATMTTAEANAAVLRWVVPFLNAKLAGDTAWEPLLGPPTLPGFVYAADGIAP
jgi:dienelactone hydrolase